MFGGDQWRQVRLLLQRCLVHGSGSLLRIPTLLINLWIVVVFLLLLESWLLIDKQDALSLQLFLVYPEVRVILNTHLVQRVLNLQGQRVLSGSLDLHASFIHGLVNIDSAGIGIWSLSSFLVITIIRVLHFLYLLNQILLVKELLLVAKFVPSPDVHLVHDVVVDQGIGIGKHARLVIVVTYCFALFKGIQGWLISDTNKAFILVFEVVIKLFCIPWYERILLLLFCFVNCCFFPNLHPMT